MKQKVRLNNAVVITNTVRAITELIILLKNNDEVLLKNNDEGPWSVTNLQFHQHMEYRMTSLRHRQPTGQLVCFIIVWWVGCLKVGQAIDIQTEVIGIQIDL